MDRIEPPVSFYFKLTVADSSGISASDVYFQEVGGIGGEIAVEEFREGGSNDTVYSLPGNVSFPNLVCKRGLAPWGSSLINWCFDTFSATGNKVVLKNIVVKLLNRDSSSTSYMTWNLYDAFPVKWSVSEFNAMESRVAIETLEFKYSRLELGP